MKESKTYFSQDNRLNKGYSNDKDTNKEPDQSFFKRKFDGIFPSVETICSLEEIKPGSLDKIINIAQKEQEHRHAMEKTNAEIYSRARRMGNFFGLITVAIISFATVEIARQGNNSLATIFCVSGFLAIFGVSLLSYIKAANLKKERNDRRPQQNNKNFSRNNNHNNYRHKNRR